MPSIYLQCDKCGATYMGEKHHPNGLNFSQKSLLQEEARSLGWTGDLTRESHNDLCPSCSTLLGPQKLKTPHQY
jgi:hypothetical protein